MTRWRLIVTLALAGGLLTSCSQLAPSIPGAQTTSSASTSQASGATGATPPAVTQISAAAKATPAQLGVQIFWHAVNDSYVVKHNADRLLDYVVSVGANSVGISFPIFTDGRVPTRVYTKDGVTPSPASLATVIGEAKARGLRVSLRPLIDEQNIKDGKTAWRGSIKPRNMAAWFASYQNTLMPYLTIGEGARADVFVIGSELDSLVSQGAHWQALEAAAAKVFSGRLAYADNWGSWATGRAGVPGAVPGLDAYPQLQLTGSATVAQIAGAWSAWLQKRPAGLTDTVLQEVGIAATPGAYKEPAMWAKPGLAVVPQIQAHWFVGACTAVKSLHMAGIYFWSVDAWADPAKAAGYTAGSFMGRGDSAIRSCFAEGWPGQ